MSHIPKTKDSKILMKSHFYPLLRKTSTLVKTNYLETLQVFGKMIWLSESPVSDSRSEDLIFLSCVYTDSYINGLYILR